MPTLVEARAGPRSQRLERDIRAGARAPRDIVTLLNREIVELLRMSDLKERYAAEGGMILAGTPQQFSEHIRQEIAKRAKLIKERDIELKSSSP